MNTIPERLKDPQEMFRVMFDSFAAMMRNAEPGIIDSFDPDTQTASVQLTIRERVIIDGKVQWMELPLLVDVPVFFPRAGGHMITFPVVKGDECLVIFADKCIDAWWQSGGVQNQIDKRRHDLSDGFAFVGFTSQPRKVKGYSPDSLMIRDESGDNYIQLKNDTVNINLVKEINVTVPTANVHATTVNSESETLNVHTTTATVEAATATVNAESLTAEASSASVTGGAISLSGDSVSISAAGNNVYICGYRYMDHTHRGVDRGDSRTDPVSLSI